MTVAMDGLARRLAGQMRWIDADLAIALREWDLGSQEQREQIAETLDGLRARRAALWQELLSGCTDALPVRLEQPGLVFYPVKEELEDFFASWPRGGREACVRGVVEEPDRCRYLGWAVLARPADAADLRPCVKALLDLADHFDVWELPRPSPGEEFARVVQDWWAGRWPDRR